MMKKKLALTTSILALLALFAAAARKPRLPGGAF